jgi:1,4-dihydroxy-2-naphthoate polyprenyltransferase
MKPEGWQKVVDAWPRSRLETVTWFLRLGRPKFLFYSLLLQALGAACAVKAGARFEPALFALAQLYVWCIHLMTHYCNEYCDYETDSRNDSETGWTGGSRVLVDGHLPRATALYAAVGLLAFGLVVQVAGAYVAPSFAEGRPIAILAAFFGIIYSAPPLKLHSRGLGELTVAFVVASLTPIYGFTLQAGSLATLSDHGSELGMILIVLALTQYARMIVMNIPDRGADAAVGKRTFVVIFGPSVAVKAYLALLLVAYALLVPFSVLGLPVQVALGFLIVAPLGLTQGIKLARGAWRDADQLRRIPFLCTLYVMLTALAVTVGVVSSAG